MSDVVFRSKGEFTASQPHHPVAAKNVAADTSSKVEVPYFDYQKEHGHPFLVDYFKLGDSWMETEGGYAQEIAAIEDYLDHEIENGNLPNSVSAVKAELKKLERLTNVDKEERAVVKATKLAAFSEYLLKVDGVKANLKKYGFSHHGGRHFSAMN